MTSIMRRTVRGTAAGLGALAIIAAAAACGGGEETETTDPAVSEEKPAEDEKPAEEADPAETEEGGGDASTDEGEGAASTDESEGTEEGDAAASEGGDAAAGEALTEEDLTAAGDRVFEFLQAAAGGDGETACSLITNPLNDQPFEGKGLEDCVASFGESASAAEVDPAVADMMERSMIEAVDNGDGTAGINMLGSDAGLTVLKADDGQWYVDGAATVEQQQAG